MTANTQDTYVQPIYAKSLANHQLEWVARDPFPVCYLKRPGTRIMCVLCIFSPEGIILKGDIRFGNLDVLASDLGYGLPWFASKLSESYLCEKFLRQKYVKELALAELNDPESYLRELIGEPSHPRLDELAAVVDGDDDWAWPSRIYDVLTALGVDSESIPGWGYDPVEAGYLCAVQQRFAELYPLGIGEN